MGVRNMMAFVGANTPMSFDHVCDVITIYRMWTLLIVRWLLLLLQLNTKKRQPFYCPLIGYSTRDWRAVWRRNYAGTYICEPSSMSKKASISIYTFYIYINAYIYRIYIYIYIFILYSFLGGCGRGRAYGCGWTNGVDLIHERHHQVQRCLKNKNKRRRNKAHGG